jgi:hypothetical protein
LFHAREGLVDEVGASPAGEGGGQEGYDGCVGKGEVEEGVCAWGDVSRDWKHEARWR